MEISLNLSEVNKILLSKPTLPEKQSRGVFTQISPAHSDGLRATQTSSQNFTVGYQTLQSNRLNILVPRGTTAQQLNFVKMKGIIIQAGKTRRLEQRQKKWFFCFPPVSDRLKYKRKESSTGFGGYIKSPFITR